MITYKNIILEKTTIQPKSILEVGSRDGDDSELLRDFFSINEDMVWVVEPNPNQQIKIKEKYPRFNLVTEAIYSEEGEKWFNAVRSSDLIGVSSLLDRKDGLYSNTNTERIVVNTITGYKLIERIDTEIDLCKIDVEGATFEVLKSFGDKIHMIKSMHLENEHLEVWSGQKLYDEVKTYLESMGFVEIYFQYVNNVVLQSDTIWCQKKYLK